MTVSRIALFSFILSSLCLLTWVTYFLIYINPFRIIPPALSLSMTACMVVVLGLAAFAAWRIDNSGGRLKGLAFTRIATASAMIGLAIGLLYFLGRGVHITGERLLAASDLSQKAKAMHMYRNDYEHFPPAAIRDENGSPLLSWRVPLLPYLELDALYRQLNLKEPWDSPHNQPFSDMTVKNYSSRSYLASHDRGATYYQVFVGPGAMFESDRSVKLEEVVNGDGTSNTFLIVEGGEPVPWSKPQDLPYDPVKPLPPLGRLWTPVSKYRFAKEQHGFNASFVDGSVRFMSAATDEKVLRALITRNGGEPIDWSVIEDQ